MMNQKQNFGDGGLNVCGSGADAHAQMEVELRYWNIGAATYRSSSNDKFFHRQFWLPSKNPGPWDHIHESILSARDVGRSTIFLGFELAADNCVAWKR